ncbi:MAG: 3-hydroxybutyryl-CoA dehydrogenase [Actinobacteria bacterium]|nr:3-hydroxybutyryl-CoA dehydrogenase [Actinomycetota bacterium]
MKKVGICGSGIMGSGLAEVAAKAGYTVVVRSRSAATAQAMITSIEKGLDKQVQREKISADDKAAILGRLSATDKIADLADCDLVIESVVEDLAVKKALFAELDKAVKPEAILATNTSTLPVVEMAMATGRPDKVCGIHFFNPATAMPLVEVVRPITASDETIAAANAFTAQCGKNGVQVKDRAGFIVNALLFPYLNNAIRIWETGTASMEDIDTAMKGGCNFPMGPFALLDLVGLDTSLAILEALYAEFADSNYAAVPTLRRLVAAGKLGRKSGEGFYTY